MRLARRRSLATLAALASLAVFSGACGRPAPAPAGPPDGSYSLRGEIRQLPRPEGDEILIHHEAVPDLKDASGKVVGMDSMTMGFALDPSVDRSALAEGQRISFTLEVRWNASPAARVTNVAPLPAGTRLSFDPPEAATTTTTPPAQP